MEGSMGEFARLEAKEPLDLVPAAEDERDGQVVSSAG
jgi:hypothetical protein